MKTCFSEGKLMKQFGNPLFLIGPLLSNHPPPPPPPISEQFFHDPLFVQILKTRTCPLILGGRKLWRPSLVEVLFMVIHTYWKENQIITTFKLIFSCCLKELQNYNRKQHVQKKFPFWQKLGIGVFTYIWTAQSSKFDLNSLVIPSIPMVKLKDCSFQIWRSHPKQIAFSRLTIFSQ